MSCMKIMTNNFLDPEIVSNASVTSEQAAFPASNIYNFQRRSKVYRSSGYWEVTSTNKTIIFQETIGVDLTATLVESNYASNSSFFTAIKTALEDAGTSTYTITTDTLTSKIKITSNGAGGGGIFRLIWTNVSSSGFASLTGYSTSSNDTGFLTYTADILKIHSGERLTWDMGISTNPHAFFLIGLRNSPIKISPTATIKLQGNETENWSSPSYEITLGYDDEIMAKIVELTEDGLHTESLRYWSLYIQDQSNSQGYIEIGSAFLGDYIEPTTGAPQFPFTDNQIDRSNTIFSEGGQTFSDIREKTASFSFQWIGLTTTEKESINDFFSKSGTSNPFFIVMDEDEAFSNRTNYYTRYVKFENAPSFSLSRPNNWSVTFNLREEL